MRRRRGITLLELLVGITMAAGLLMAFSQVFRAATTSRERLQDTGTRSGALRRCYETLNRDIHSAVVPPDDSGVTFGLTTGNTSASTGGDVLEFASSVGEPILAGRAATETVLIQYVIAEDPRTGIPTLFRYETPYPVPDGSSGGSTGGMSEDTRTLPLLPGVSGATYLFYSSEQQTWVDTWEGAAGLPTAIRVDLALSDGGEQSQAKVQSWVFSVPAAQFANDEATAAAAAAEAGTTTGAGGQ
ncbi:MAG: Type secretion system protein [Armatimonadetes bacterium]|jgi:type II secretory pathway pseudopilin PulG|nr:Type secretion system protein [Armatimonadota bacterium]